MKAAIGRRGSELRYGSPSSNNRDGSSRRERPLASPLLHVSTSRCRDGLCIRQRTGDLEARVSYPRIISPPLMLLCYFLIEALESCFCKEAVGETIAH